MGGQRGEREMSGIFRGARYSARSWLLALFVMVAIILGGGGTPNPATEILLEIVLLVFAAAWIWLPRETGTIGWTQADRLALALVAVVLVVPVVQLVPLPPSVWAVLPGRENELAALALVGQETSWRPVSLSPARTLASLLSTIPALFCLFAVSQLEIHERRLVLAAIVLMAIVTALLGGLQLTAGGRGLNLYPEHHVGWVTGFQANRNAAADLLLIGLLALAVLAAPYLASNRERRPLRINRRALSILTALTALLLILATVMTGSRTGTVLILVSGAAALAVFAFGPAHAPRAPLPRTAVLVIAAGAAFLIAVFLALAGTTAVGRVALRFADIDTSRAEIWQDTWFALKQYWPVGFGMGGFEPAMLPAERLEVLDPSVPNRAHNDFLEIGLEAGILGYAVLAAAALLCLFLAWRAWRDAPAMRRQVVFGLGVLLIIGLHSFVDYPLRSMAIACLAGVATGTLIENRVPAERQRAHGRTPQLKDFA